MGRASTLSKAPVGWKLAVKPTKELHFVSLPAGAGDFRRGCGAGICCQFVLEMNTDASDR